MESPQAHIFRIRRDKYFIDDEHNRLLQPNPLTKDLNSSIHHLSEGLYSEDVHFVFELIQNAEDNVYGAGIEPSLSFCLVKTDPTNTSDTDGALIIHNNERGFNESNVAALCAVGQSTKTVNSRPI